MRCFMILIVLVLILCVSTVICSGVKSRRYNNSGIVTVYFLESYFLAIVFAYTLTLLPQLSAYFASDKYLRILGQLTVVVAIALVLVAACVFMSFYGRFLSNNYNDYILIQTSDFSLLDKFFGLQLFITTISDPKYIILAYLLLIAFYVIKHKKLRLAEYLINITELVGLNIINFVLDHFIKYESILLFLQIKTAQFIALTIVFSLILPLLNDKLLPSNS